MGKGRIIGVHGEGRYTLEILEDCARADAARTRSEQLLAEVDEQIEVSQINLDGLQEEVDSNADVLQAAIQDFHNTVGNEDGNDSEKEAMQKANERFLASVSWRDEARARTSSLKLRRAGLQSRLDRINKLPPLRQMDAWCADLTENLSGEVATAEVPGEVGHVLIRPGFDDGAAWNASRDGAIQPVLSSTPAATFYNLAMLPGWQRWRPTYRIATVSNIDNDLCDITLDAATSSQQGLNVNAQTHYSGVPIMYMDCNGDAFEEGDRALVAFSASTDRPVVVGFEQEPRECCSCEPTILGTSPSSGTWDVMDIFGSSPVSACPVDEWRIVNRSQDAVIHSGGLRKENGQLYLDGLPEQLATSVSELVVDGAYHCNPPEDIEQTYGLPRPDPMFWGGSWSSHYLGGGEISDTGSVITWWDEAITSWLVIWTVDDCFKFEVTYHSPPRSYELQLGCKQPDGSVEWPE